MEILYLKNTVTKSRNSIHEPKIAEKKNSDQEDGSEENTQDETQRKIGWKIEQNKNNCQPRILDLSK